MKKAISSFSISVMIIGILFSSCVSSKKFKASEANLDKLQKENANTHNQLSECNAQLKNLKEEQASLVKENEISQKELKSLSKESKLTIADQAKRLKYLQDIIQEQKDVMSDLKNSLADALMNYTTDELNVYIKDGNVYVSLEEKLLFKSGSDVVDPKGKEALNTLAKVLKTTKDISVIIEGHTDNVPIKTKEFEDNWDLSTARATSIVRILTDFGFNPIRITASGKGSFHPIKTNDTAIGKASNRRTEVILSPDLKEVFFLLYQ